MRTLLLWLLMLAPPISIGAELESVSDPLENNCKDDACTHYEWGIRGLPSLRIVAERWEDSSTYMLYSKSRDGKWERLLAFEPVMEDLSRGGKLYEAWFNFIDSIPTCGLGEDPCLYVSFDYSESDQSVKVGRELESLKPLIKLGGSQPDYYESAELTATFCPMKLSAIVQAVRANQSLHPDAACGRAGERRR